MAKLTGPEHICKNCETEFIGHFCPNCSQSVRDFNRSFKVLVLDVLGNTWAFDVRFFNTIKSLLFKPGRIAVDYVAGRRERYMPPFRLYFFISIFFFMLLNIATSRSLKDGVKINASISTDEATKSKEESAKSNEADKLQIDTKVFSFEGTNKNKKLMSEINQNKSEYTTRFISLLSWSLFILMPLYAALLWVLFRKKQKYYMAHFIFSINQHSFLFILFLILISFYLIFPEKTISPESWLLLLYPLYVIKGSKTLYQKSWLSTILRVTFAHFIYFLTVLVAIVIIFYLTFEKALTNM